MRGAIACLYGLLGGLTLTCGCPGNAALAQAPSTTSYVSSATSTIGDWTYWTVHDGGSVTGVLAVKSESSVRGANISTILFERTPHDAWDALAWNTSERSVGIANAAAVALAERLSSDKVRSLTERVLEKPVASDTTFEWVDGVGYAHGAFIDDPLRELFESADPAVDSLLALLVEIGWPATDPTLGLADSFDGPVTPGSPVMLRTDLLLVLDQIVVAHELFELGVPFEDMGDSLGGTAGVCWPTTRCNEVEGDWQCGPWYPDGLVDIPGDDSGARVLNWERQLTRTFTKYCGKRKVDCEYISWSECYIQRAYQKWSILVPGGLDPNDPIYRPNGITCPQDATPSETETVNCQFP